MKKPQRGIREVRRTKGSNVSAGKGGAAIGGNVHGDVNVGHIELHVHPPAAPTASDPPQANQSPEFVAWAGRRGLVDLAIVFTDILDSTRLNNKYGIEGWEPIRSAHFGRAREVVDKHRGHLIKTVGDGIMAAFRNSVDAVRFARELEFDPGHSILRIRAGVHAGLVQIKEGDAFGPDVNLAARICAKAEHGGIWVSDRVHADWLKNDPEASLKWARHNDVELKGFIEHLVLWSLPASRGGPLPDYGSIPPEALRCYLDWLIAECAPLKLKAISQSAAKPGAEPLGLKNVYVDLNLDLRIGAKLSLAEHLESQKQPGQDSERPGEREMRMQAERETRLVPALEALAHHRRLVLLGAPGSGKSTFVAYVALGLAEALVGKEEALQRLGEWWSVGALLPVRVVLRQFAASMPKNLQQGRAQHLWDFIEADLAKSVRTPAAAGVPRLAAAHSGALFLLDGLDEVRDESTRARMLEAVAEFARAAGPACRFLLTARPYAWDEFKDPKSAPPGSTPAELAQMHTAYRLADFEEGQIDTFIGRWYAAIQAAGWPVSEPAQKVQELQQAARRADLVPLARNPLLLTLMATLHSNRAKLPEDRADLYEEVVELLLHRWNEQIGADRGLLDALSISTLTLDHLRKVIERLAFEAHAANVGKEGVADLAEGVLLNGLRPLLAKDTGKAALALQYIEDRAGLLLGQGEKGGQRQYTFPHRTFQEYLAACHLAGRNDFCTMAARIARQNPAHWREALTLAARRAGADRGVPAANALVHGLGFEEWARANPPADLDWRAAIVAAEQLLEIGLAVVESDEAHQAVRDRVASWLAALLETGTLPVRERVQAGVVLGRLGDARRWVGLTPDGLPDIDFVPSEPARPLSAGKFTLGENRQTVVIKEPYRISRYPVTVAQYQAFVDAKGYEQDQFWSAEGRAWRDGKVKLESVPEWYRDEYRQEMFPIRGPKDYSPVFQTPNHPRVGVSWYEAVAFCRWLSEKTRREIRLPQEAEWEQAARWNKPKEQVDDRAYPWGNQTSEADLTARCNWDKTGIGHTSAVGLFPDGNAECGAADLSGNVWEWCENWYDESRKEHRVLRGGSWGFDRPEILSCSFRNFFVPGCRHFSIGFRCVWVGESVP